MFLIQRLDDFDPLHAADGQIPNVQARVDVQTVFFRQPLHGFVALLGVCKRTTARLPSQHDVLGHRQRREQHEMLVHHADA